MFPPPITPPQDPETRRFMWIWIFALVLIASTLIAIQALKVGNSSSESKETGGPSSTSVIPEIKPRNPSFMTVVGDLNLPVGSPDVVSVIWRGNPTLVETYGGKVYQIPLVVRNNSMRTVSSVKVKAIIRDSNGNAVGSSELLSIDPLYIEPGAWGTGILEQKSDGISSIRDLDISLFFEEGKCKVGCPVFGEISELRKSGSKIEGIVQAPREGSGMGFGFSGLFSDVDAHIHCFSRNSAFLGEQVEKVATDLEPAEATFFTIELKPELARQCKSFAIYIE